MGSQLLFAIVSGLASGMAFFLVAGGLTWLFGILKILNMAHGAFFMVGAYVAFTMVGAYPPSMLVFFGGALAAAAALAVIGYLTDLIVLRRLRSVDYHYVLIATFALLMFCEGVAKLVWGMDYVSAMPPPALDAPVKIMGLYLSRYMLFVIAAGLVVFVLLDVLLHRTSAGKVMQAVANDPWMASVLGVNVPLILSGSVVASFALAGFAGGVLVPNQTLSPYLGASYLLYAFFAVVIGGLGNVRGAFLACVMLGLIESLNATFVPHYPGLAIYIALAACLVWRPTGLIPGAAR